MKGLLLTCVLAILAAAHSSGAVEGTVRNLTTGKPAAGAVVTMVELGAGMKNVGSVKSDPSGKFQFDAVMEAGTPYLIQALHQGVTYNRMLPPGTAGTGIALEVYDSSAKVPEARVTQDMILLEKTPSELSVSETVIFTNTAKMTYQNAAGNLVIQVPPDVKTPVRMRITAPQGMPITREPEKGLQPNTYVARYPIKPGETRIDFSYSLPAAASFSFAGRILHGGGPVRFVVPQGIKVESASLTDLGPEPRTKAQVYELKGTEFAVNVSGAGQLRSAAEDETRAAAGPAAEEDNTPGIDLVKPRIYQRMPLLVGLALGMLAIGFAMMYSKGSQA